MGERVLRGAPASPGLAAGRARILFPLSETSARAPVAEAELRGEARRAQAALREAAVEFERIAGGLRESGREQEAEIVETGALMAADPVLDAAVEAAIEERRLTAGEALLAATEEHALIIEALPDPVLAARADDVRSLGRRAARIAQGAGTDPGTNGSTFILVAEDLGPADVAEHGERAAGIALSAGAVTAHAAIVARSLGIPMTVQAGAELLRVAEGAPILVDGAEGEVVVEASADRLEAAKSASRARAQARALERADRELPAITADGRRVLVLVNAATGAEVAAGLAAGAEGAGLIRTELAFLDADGWPSRAQHASMLGPILGGLPGAIATVRVLDFGGDKIPPFLRAEPRRGIELPEAAEAAREIAAESDFLSIGTNDLTHATLGTDRFAHGEAPAHDP
ncbi:MAG TPA: putative PEP-binding protein, partial [Thermoleophilaceae bacterium]|nr:putative PEP-binding protein [Thermoleophilaceae bacterium]